MTALAQLLPAMALCAAMANERAMPLTHTLAGGYSLHDGGGIFTLVLCLVMIPWSLAVIFNYRGMAERRWRRGRRITPPFPRIFAGIFFILALVLLGFAIHRFAQGGY
jgi:hypothetical protein